MRLVLFALIFVAVALSQTGSFVVPSTAGILWGSHGDNTSQQNATGIPIPASVAQVWINNANGNSGVSVGCVTNGAVAPSLVACKTNSISTGSHIQVYNASTGAVVCSDTLAGVSTHTNVSVPIIAADGSIFIFDDQAATRINSSCAVAWSTSRTGALAVGGKAAKPTPYGDYLLAEATNGMLALYNASTGSLVAGPVYVSCQTPSTTACTVGGGGTSSSYFVNTNDQACIAGVAEGGSIGATGTLMRCYYVGQNTALSQPNNLLFAVDVTSSAINITSWSAPFNGPSQATPDWTPGGNIVVDACSNGCTPVDVAIYAFADSWPTTGAGALTTSWSVCASGCSVTATLPRYIDANMSYNPYGAILAAYFHSGQLDSRCVGTGLTSGCSAGWTMNLTGSLVGLTGGAASDVLSPVGEKTIGKTSGGDYAVIMGVQDVQTGSSYNGWGWVLALDLSTQAVVWYYQQYGEPNTAGGQFPIANGAAGAEVCFSASASGPSCAGLGAAGVPIFITGSKVQLSGSKVVLIP